MLLFSLALAATASAEETVSQAGEGAGQTKNPAGLATDFESGRLYVADRGNSRVDVFDSAGNFEMAFGWGVLSGKAKLEICTAITGCHAGLPGSGEGQFSAPTEIAVDNDSSSSSQHDIYVVDGTSRVQKFNPEGKFLLSFGSFGTGDGQLDHPQGVGVDADAVYVADDRNDRQ